MWGKRRRRVRERQKRQVPTWTCNWPFEKSTEVHLWIRVWFVDKDGASNVISTELGRSKQELSHWIVKALSRLTVVFA